MLIAVIPPLGLTPRQYEIALLVMQGKSDWTISQELGIRFKTVKYQLSDVYDRLGIKSRTQLCLKLWWENENANSNN